MSAPIDFAKEALRQQMLLRALLGDARPGVVAGWLRDRPERVARGLQAYRANAAALAGRALAAAFPTLAQLLGPAATAGLARAYWHAEPPQRGDVAEWGARLPAFIDADPQLAAEPYLGDVARLDWAVHRAEQAADAPPATGLSRLATDDPVALWLQLSPGTTLVSSIHPVATLWQAHQTPPDAWPDVLPETLPDALPDALPDVSPSAMPSALAKVPAPPGDRFAPVRAAFAAGAGEHVRVSRGVGWRADVRAVTEAEARFTRAVLEGDTLGRALQSAGAPFEFEPWLVANLQAGCIVAVLTQAPHTSGIPP